MSIQTTPLTNFAPLIQLWAGICAICFYDSLVKNLIVTEKRAALNKQLYDIKEQLHDLLPDSKHELMTLKIDENLEGFRHKVTHLGKLTCCVAIALLAIAGFECTYSYHYEWLCLVMTVFFLYVLCQAMRSENRRSAFYRKPWAFAVSAIVIIGLMAFGFSDLSSLPDFGRSAHFYSFAAIIALFVSVPILVCKFYSDERMSEFRYDLMEILGSDFRNFAAIQSMGANSEGYEKLSKEVMDVIKDIPTKNQRREKFDEYVLSYLDNLFDYDSRFSYKFHTWKDSKINAFSKNCHAYCDPKIESARYKTKEFRNKNADSIFKIFFVYIPVVAYILILMLLIVGRC